MFIFFVTMAFFLNYYAVQFRYYAIPFSVLCKFPFMSGIASSQSSRVSLLPGIASAFLSFIVAWRCFFLPSKASLQHGAVIILPSIVLVLLQR